MLQTKTRPLLPVFFLLALGIYLSSFAVSVAAAAWVSIGLAVLWLYLEYRGSGSARCLFWLLVVLAGFFLAVTDRGYLPDCDDPLALTGRVLDVRELSRNQRVIVYVPEFKSRLALHLPAGTPLNPGDWLWFSGVLQKPERARNPGEFDYRDYLRSQSIYAVMEPAEFQVLDKKAWFTCLLASLQDYVRSNCCRHMRNPGLAAALILGDRNALGKEQQDLWEKLGITHLLAVSGTHIGLLAAILWFGCRPVPVSRRLKAIVISLILLLYVLLSGGKPSAWRAWLAAVIVMGRAGHLDGLHVWSLAGVIMLTANPGYLWQIGFQLSFAASGGVILWSPAIRKLTARFAHGIAGRLLGKTCTSIAVSLIAQLSLIPLLLKHFGQIALLAPIATMMLLPFVAVLVGGGIFLGLCGSLAAPLGRLLDIVTETACRLCAVLAKADCLITAPSMPSLWAFAWYLAFTGLGGIARKQYLRLGRPTWCRWANLALAVLLIVSMPYHCSRPLEITFLDVGQGDCILIRTPFRQHILIDGGGDSVYWQQRGRNVGLTTVVPYLRHRGIDHLDLVILSHPHEDHLYGLLAVLEHVSIGMAADSGQPHDTPTYRRYLELIEEKQIPYISLAAGDRLVLRGGVQLTVLHPRRFLTGTSSDLNNNSLVINLRYQGRNVLLTGDLDLEGMEVLLGRGDLFPVDLVKVPHHGSRAALFPEFYQAIQPQYAVISVGGNSFGHPHPEVLAYLEQAGISASCTDQEGAVSFYIWNGLCGRYSRPR